MPKPTWTPGRVAALIAVGSAAALTTGVMSIATGQTTAQEFHRTAATAKPPVQIAKPAATPVPSTCPPRLPNVVTKCSVTIVAPLECPSEDSCTYKMNYNGKTNRWELTVTEETP